MLISEGKILENNKTLRECRSPLCDILGGVTTMHVVIQQPSSKKEKKGANKLEQSKCMCYIMICILNGGGYILLRKDCWRW